MSETNRPIILILGPTAGGKTALSIALAQSLPGGGEVISADSMQVYRGMDIGTAKPPMAERDGVPHHLLDLVEPSEEGFTVDSWLEAADAAIADVRSRGKWPLIVGGTNLYVQALLHGLHFGPAPDEAVRERFRAMDPVERRKRLEEVDPVSAARIHPHDERRTVRALEVHAGAGRPMSEVQRDWTAVEPREDALTIALDWPVEAINRRINARVRQMMDEGLADEVYRLMTGPGLGLQARQALAYRQIADVFEAAGVVRTGDAPNPQTRPQARPRADLQADPQADPHADQKTGQNAAPNPLAPHVPKDAVEQIKIRTRRYAKQQRTWLRRFRGLPRSYFLDAATNDPQAIHSQALKIIHQEAGLDPNGPSGHSSASFQP
ncbi:MAG: tRNA (adenosine(37)-N6)-dimethylallyltransferase MiaA [Phycisphaerales bacterium]